MCWGWAWLARPGARGLILFAMSKSSLMFGGVRGVERVLRGVPLVILGLVDFRRVVMTTAPPANEPISEDSVPAV